MISHTLKLNYRIEVSCRIIVRTGQGQLTFRSNVTPCRLSTIIIYTALPAAISGRGAAATTRLESIHPWTRGSGASWHNARYPLPPPLLFVGTSCQYEYGTTTYRQLAFNYKHLRGRKSTWENGGVSR